MLYLKTKTTIIDNLLFFYYYKYVLIFIRPGSKFLPSSLFRTFPLGTFPCVVDDTEDGDDVDGVTATVELVLISSSLLDDVSSVINDDDDDELGLSRQHTFSLSLFQPHRSRAWSPRVWIACNALGQSLTSTHVPISHSSSPIAGKKENTLPVEVKRKYFKILNILYILPKNALLSF